MTNNFFNSLKSVFVTEIPDENTNVEQVTNNNVMKETSVQPTQVMFTSNVVNTQKTIEGQINEELLQKLCKVMEDSNLPGPDYMELKNVANNDDMKKAIPNEHQRLSVSFITLKSSSPEMSKERVLNSIDEYLKIIENERKSAHEQLSIMWGEKVDKEKEAVNNAEKRIAELQAELTELINFVQTKNNEIITASNECNINKANFDATADFLVNNLISDKNTLNNILN